MKAMIKLDIQLETVDSAIPFARARSGKISAPSNQGVGPQLFPQSVRGPMISERKKLNPRGTVNEKVNTDSTENTIRGGDPSTAKRKRIGVEL